MSERDEPVKATEVVRKARVESAPHALQVCPNCSTELRDKTCKLVCPLCGYFLSCSDFY
jgi:hypothetical protein